MIVLQTESLNENYLWRKLGFSKSTEVMVTATVDMEKGTKMIYISWCLIF